MKFLIALMFSVAAFAEDPADAALPNAPVIQTPVKTASVEEFVKSIEDKPVRSVKPRVFSQTYAECAGHCQFWCAGMRKADECLCDCLVSCSETTSGGLLASVK